MVRSEDVGLLAGFVLVVALVIGGIVFYYDTWSECNAKSGVLVKNAYDMPTCVEMRTK